MSLLIQSCLRTLQETRVLILNLNNEQFCDKSIAPYHSSIGSHIRHILDFYNCIVNENEDGVDLTNRERNPKVETCCNSALNHLNSLEETLQKLNNDEKRQLQVTDDLGQGIICLDYTFGALMAQANSHTIHHHAIINYILNQLDIKVSDLRFGFNPTTPIIVDN